VVITRGQDEIRAPCQRPCSGEARRAASECVGVIHGYRQLVAGPAGRSAPLSSGRSATPIPGPTASSWAARPRWTDSAETAATSRRQGSRKVIIVVAKGSGGSESADKNRPMFRMTRARRIGDAIIGAFIRAGVVPSSYMLTTKGRKTGQLLTNPVTLVERDGRRWLAAPYGPVSWVLNARSAGWVTLRRRGRRLNYTVREVPTEEAGPVLMAGLRRVP